MSAEPVGVWERDRGAAIFGTSIEPRTAEKRPPVLVVCSGWAEMSASRWQTARVLKRVESLSSHAREVLPPSAMQRFEAFRQLEPGWDGGGGERMSLDSVACMNAFLARVSHFPTSPSLFLTPGGYLELQWEDDGRTVDLHFLADTVDFFAERFDREAAVSPHSLDLSTLGLE